MGRGKYKNLKNRFNNLRSLYMLPQFSPRNKTSVCNRNDANSMVHKGLIFLFGGTIWELGIVIYSKSCYVSPHMSEMEIKEPTNTRIYKPRNRVLLSCRIASFHVFVHRILPLIFGPKSTHERQTTKRIYPAAYGNNISILVKQEL